MADWRTMTNLELVNVAYDALDELDRRGDIGLRRGCLDVPYLVGDISLLKRKVEAVPNEGT